MQNKKKEILNTAYEYIDKLNNGIKIIVEKIQEGNEYEAIKLIPSVADGIDWLTQTIKVTEEVQKEPISIDNLNEQLESLVEAFENEDYILLGDLFNYEIMPILCEYKEKIEICL